MGKRKYTVSTVLGSYTPSIKLTGKWLNEIGLNIGDKLELIESKNMIILAKIPNDIVIKEQKAKQLLELTKKLETIKNN